MARGRFISNSISTSKKFARLAKNDHRLMYLMLVPHVDAEGRHDADARILNGQVYTLLGLTTNEIEAGLEDMHAVGLISLYRVKDERYLEITNFHEHNKVRRDKDGNPSREAPSGIPAPSAGTVAGPTPDQLRSNSAPTPAQGEGLRVKSKVQVQVQAQEKEMSSANADTPPPKPDEPTLRDLIEIWNAECGNLRRVADIELGLANTTLTRLSNAFFKRHRKRPDKGLDIFRAGIPAVVNDPHWLGPRAEKPTRTGNVYGLDNYLRNVETKAEAAAAMTATGPSGRPTGPVRFRVGHAVYRPSTGEYDFIEELLDPKTARMSNGETWNLEGCERWTN